jgi:hypothetical protein
MNTKLHLLVPSLCIAVALPLVRADGPPACVCTSAGPGGGALRAFAMNASDVAPATIPFLGVETDPASSTLTEQLGLPDNTGLVVEEVVPGSAAAAALKRHDILLKLDDQVLIEPRQLSVLVRGHKVGDAVTVTFLRAGKQGTASVTLGRHEAPKMSEWGEEGPGAMPFKFNIQGLSREDMDRMLSLMNNPPMEPPPPPGVGPTPRPPAPPNVSEFDVDVANSNIVYTDDQGTLALTIKNGRKTLDARDPQGHELFSGPIDTPEQRRAMPAEVLGRLDKLHGMREFSFKTDRDYQGADTRVARPEGQSMPIPPALPQSSEPPF